jgi:hypothetical protein
MGLEGYLVERLAQIVIEREEVLVRLEEIRSKMKRADAKRSGQENTPNYKKWSSILRGLEHDHDKHKALITTLEAETKEKTARYNKIRNDREAHQSKLEANYARIMSLPPEEMAALTPEDLELLQEYELQMEAAEKAAKEAAAVTSEEGEAQAPIEVPEEPELKQYVQVTEFQAKKEPPRESNAQPAATAKSQSPVEEEKVQTTPVKPAAESSRTKGSPSAPNIMTRVVAPETVNGGSANPVSAPIPQSQPSARTESQAFPANASGGSDAKSRRKNAFQSALEKSQQGAISSLTFEEVAVMLTAYRKIASQPSSSPHAAALEENVAGAMWEVHAHCARICANWADIVRRETNIPKI